MESNARKNEGRRYSLMEKKCGKRIRYDHADQSHRERLYSLQLFSHYNGRVVTTGHVAHRMEHIYHLPTEKNTPTHALYRHFQSGAPWEFNRQALPSKTEAGAFHAQISLDSHQVKQDRAPGDNQGPPQSFQEQEGQLFLRRSDHDILSSRSSDRPLPKPVTPSTV